MNGRQDLSNAEARGWILGHWLAADLLLGPGIAACLQGGRSDSGAVRRLGKNPPSGMSQVTERANGGTRDATATFKPPPGGLCHDLHRSGWRRAPGP